ncbi:O-acetyl-ADP-ribose deacetylase (regulator of RNase III), contains Macro domain [Arachidicoccus rhizosphaerae]|uniref:O-acetyl-ADP-ribose deacetylase (Regulator of RNase III), contains Macro domain n=1 Tax=Arachidicoccus rhizosphaerae TaxID=551991 RepID=A0A1H4AYS8_9BACT|nr:O-acetyl-ADP-ribose deacetylase [Arachidicoccus rhizosphaerae]SEA40974.1 O-acetyl-ADP-ribose deacetylase (regulator of RNase III), contains Macro domain [Arachidicoccus rhizosphaerae]
MIEVIKGDITKVSADIIVNAANNTLLGGGGVDGAIHRAAGKAILEQCLHIRHGQGGCKTGEAVITTAGHLNARYIIHTVGPLYQDGHHREAALLAACYKNSLMLALRYAAHSIAFPNISTGIYGYPKQQAASIAIATVRAFLGEYTQIKKVLFVCYDQENFTLYSNLL